MEGDKLIDQNLIPVLSIDGGGIRGIIPAVILNFLESELQKLDGPNARIADYFYTVAGTNTGGLMTAFLTCPDERSRPLLTAKEIKEFYLQESHKIFPQPRGHMRVLQYFRGPKYDGAYMRKVIRRLLGEKRLHDALTNVVIMAYDITLRDLVVFSSHEIKNLPSRDALLSDACIATLATPGYLPSHYFETIDPSNIITKFNLVDGVVVTNNPILVAVGETVRELTGGNDDFGEASKLGQFLLLSIGTATKRGDAYSSLETSKWGFWDWVLKRGVSPIVNVFNEGRETADEKLLPLTIQTLNAEDYYLRIQDDTLSGDLSSMDKATEKNLKKLVEVGEELLWKKVSKRNPKTGILEPCSRESNAEALIRIAKLLSESRKRRANPVLED